jgi:cell division protein ZapE
MQLDALYASRVAAAGLHDDPDQRKLIEHFQRVSDQLSARPVKTWKNFLGKAKPQAIKGLYIYGGVGRGKTWMMDMKSRSFDCISIVLCRWCMPS